MRNIQKYIDMEDPNSWAIRIVSRPEIDYPLEVIAYGDGRSGGYDANLYISMERQLLKKQKLKKGAYKTIPNNVKQSRIDQLDSDEDESLPLIKDGQEWMFMDGVHNMIEFADNNRHFKICRFHRQEKEFASVFNQVLEYTIFQLPSKRFLQKYICSVQEWDN